MRLLNIDNFEFSREYYRADGVPEYVAVSHRWLESGEATYQDVIKKQNRDGEGFKKVAAFAKFVKENVQGVRHIWIDTVCINKDASSELSEAVNSMFEWYRKAELCIAYLADVETADDYRSFEASLWFTRGWTLQELLAPPTVLFVTRNWEVIGNKGASSHSCIADECGPGLEARISKVTRIPKQVLYDYNTSLDLGVEEKMRWMDGRKTTREEDLFYALYGIFGVSGGANYGEREAGAKLRLRKEISNKMYMDGLPGAPITMPSRPARQDAVFSAIEEGNFLELKSHLREMPSAVHISDAKGRSALHLAARAANIDMVKLLIRKEAKVNIDDDDGRTPLHYAVEAGSAPVTRALLMKGANQSARDFRDETPRDLCEMFPLVAWILDHGGNLEVKDKDDFTPLCKFAKNGHFEAVRNLLDMGADIEGVGSYHRTALFEAVKENREEIVRLLLESGASVSKRDQKSDTPLILAGWYGHTRIGKLLLDHGANVNDANDYSYTALHECCDHNRLEMAMMLMQRGADLHLHDSMGHMPLHLAARHGHVDLVRAMLDSGCDINSETRTSKHGDQYQGTPLAIACWHNQPTVAKLLIERGAKVDSLDTHHYTPLCRATQNRAVECVRMLLDAGVDIERRNRDGWTPLHEASHHNSSEITELLIARGAVIDARDSAQYTPLHRAPGSKATTCAYMLLLAGADIEAKNNAGYTPLHEACHHNQPAIAGLLLLRSAKVNSRDAGQYTPLSRAAQYCNLDCVHLLLSAGADITIPCEAGWTPLHEVCFRSGNTEFIRLLLKHANDHNIDAVGIRDQDKCTPLHRAVQNNYAAAVACLLDYAKNVDIDAVENNGHSPLMEACHRNHVELVKLLLKRGARKDVREDKTGAWRTARDCAVEREHEEVIRILDEWPETGSEKAPESS